VPWNWHLQRQCIFRVNQLKGCVEHYKVVSLEGTTFAKNVVLYADQLKWVHPRLT
jgi:hypothetical protein